MKFKSVILVITTIVLTILMINVETKVNAVSNDTSLSTISINPVGTGLKQDSQNNKIYRVEVDNNITSVTINAVPSNSKSKVTVRGNNELEVGTNKVTVQVTAEDGTSEQYLVYVRRMSKPLSETNIIPNVQEEGDVYQDENNKNNIAQNTTGDIDKTVENGIENEENKEEQENAITDGNIVENQEKNQEDDTKSEEQKQNIEMWIFIATLSVIIILAVVILIKRKHK